MVLGLGAVLILPDNSIPPFLGVLLFVCMYVPT